MATKTTLIRTREDKAQELLLNSAVEHLVGNLYRVHGSIFYTVVLGAVPTCNCPDHEVRGTTECKHIIACELYKESNTQAHTQREMVVA
jgi:predicted nucleic acid-binding Zn finger protein